jgi:hypothetical protein
VPMSALVMTFWAVAAETIVRARREADFMRG